MLQKFVYYTGAFDMLIGFGTYFGAFYDPQLNQFVPLITLGTFLLLSAALLMWASRDMVSRAPVIFWQAMCRFSLVIAVIIGVPNGWATPYEYGVAAFDGSIALVYVIGMMKVTGKSFFQLFFCQETNN